MLVDVAVPEMAVPVLAYEAPVDIKPGVRVIVEIKKSRHAGFVLGRSVQEIDEAKPIDGIIDDRPVLDADLWDLSLWAGNVCMCGAGEALKCIVPRHIYMGWKAYPPPEISEERGEFHENFCFNPFDSERVNFFLSELGKPGRSLILFPSKEAAKSFYEKLPDELKYEAILWPSGSSPKLWECWQLVQSRKFRIVVAPPGGIFSPLMPRRIIVEDEANPSYVIPYSLNLSARSLAGHRAKFLGAEFITSGSIPSLKTYRRIKPKESQKPDRSEIILASIHDSWEEEAAGIVGKIPLTFSLVKRTYRELVKGRNVIWILDRAGDASEVFCGNCGEVIKCPKCGGVMRSFNDGGLLSCRKCGTLIELPENCGKCGYKIFTGRRPGIEALAEIAGKYYRKVKLYVKGSKASRMSGLVISTRRGLELCGRINPGLVAWLDLDAELWGQSHTAKYDAFSMLWESYWKGREIGTERKVLIQSRREGMKLAEYLSGGWTRFIRDELREREEFMLPPYGYIVEIECGDRILRGEIMDCLTDAGIFVMDPGDDAQPLYMNCKSLDEVRNVLEAKLTLKERAGHLVKITVRSE